jgi:hypothetical protein
MERTRDSLPEEPIFGFLDSDDVGIFGTLFDDDFAAIVQGSLEEVLLSDFDFWAAGNSIASSVVSTHQNPHAALFGNDVVEPNSHAANSQCPPPKFLDPRLAFSQCKALLPSSQIVTSSLPAVIMDKTSIQPDHPHVSLQIHPDNALVLPEFLVADSQTTGAAHWTHPSVPFLPRADNVPGQPIDLNPDPPETALPPFESLPFGLQPYIYGPHAPGNIHPTASSDNPISTTFEIGNHLLDQSLAPPNDDRSQQDPFPPYNIQRQAEFSDIHSIFTGPWDLQLNNPPFPIDFPAAPTGVSNLKSHTAPAFNNLSASQVAPETAAAEPELSTPDFILAEIPQVISDLRIEDPDILVAEDFLSISSQPFSPRTAALLRETDELMAETFPSLFLFDFNGKESQIISLDPAVIEPISTFPTRSVPLLVSLMS